MTPATLDRRTLERVRVDDSPNCWEWTAAPKKTGYGHIQIQTGENKYIQAHRAVYELLVGKIPDGLVIDHLCRNRRCVNPDHLEPVTTRENLRRGFGVTGRNARKTHCPKGHPYEGENLVIDGGFRKCRICVNTNQRIRWHRRVAP